MFFVVLPESFMGHIPVLLRESIELLNISTGDRIIDATFGGGGHAEAILANNESCYVLGVDRDEEAADRAALVALRYPGRFRFINTIFSNIRAVIEPDEKFDAILFDFGVSSFQIDNPDRGFSFSKDGILDMRMSRVDGISALDVVNDFSEQDIADIIYNYGDEPKARKIAASIIKNRQAKKISTTFQLKSIIDEIFGGKRSKIENATKTFQALRIYVNDELSEISKALESLEFILNHGARVVTISFHSLEDRIVKMWQKNNASIFKSINKKVIKPSREEIQNNVRARSAVLRGMIYE